jgi:adenine-specific DNA-methyltransferase
MRTRLSVEERARQKRLLTEQNAEDPAYLTEQLITYIGNKRSLLANIGHAMHKVKRRLNKDRLRIFDVFAGSGVVSRFFKGHASRLVSNDFEDYAAVAARCYLRNRSEVNCRELGEAVRWLNSEVEARPFPRGFIEELYAPRDERKIKKSDRVFYTRGNARRLDNYRRLLDELPVETRNMLLGPLLSEASVHANTAGVFKGFYKDRKTGIGRFGGSNADALSRIRGTIELGVPVLSRVECDVEIRQEDANVAARTVRDIDLAYLDPPYNQHPYGSNYFMLNLLVHYRRPGDISRVSGIPADWRRSGYNVKSKSMHLMHDVLHALDARFLLISFNDEGFITPEDMERLLAKLGKVSRMDIQYNAFRGSRNLHGRNSHVTEQLFLVERR